MSVRYLTLSEILRIHFEVIEDYGGSHGIRDEKSLASIIGAPKQIVFGREQYQSVFQKAAVYLRNIIGDHPFIDGNKRTATAACGVFLMLNDKSMSARPIDLEDFIVDIVIKHKSIDEIATWLESNCN